MCRLEARRVGGRPPLPPQLSSLPCLVDLKEKGATPQDRRFLYVYCIKRTTAALGVGVEIIEPDHHVLNHLVTSFVAQVERAASVGSMVGIAVGNPDVVRLPASSRSTGRRQVGSHEHFSEAGVKGARPDGGRVIDALFFGRITFSFFEATAVHCASDAVTMVAYVGCCVGSGTGNHFLEHWRTKLQTLVK